MELDPCTRYLFLKTLLRLRFSAIFSILFLFLLNTKGTLERIRLSPLQEIYQKN